MSTETIMLFGSEITRENFINLAGLFGGFFPVIVDLLERQGIKPAERIELCKLFYFVKFFLLPLCALVITSFATSSGVVSSWLAGLYLGATFPIMIQKVVNAKPHSIEMGADA